MIDQIHYFITLSTLFVKQLIREGAGNVIAFYISVGECILGNHTLLENDSALNVAVVRRSVHVLKFLR
jgi:hypothetical protein